VEINEFLKNHPATNVLACLVGVKTQGPCAVPQAIQSIQERLKDYTSWRPSQAVDGGLIATKVDPLLRPFCDAQSSPENSCATVPMGKKSRFSIFGRSMNPYFR
jgi:hypothetical protein